VQGDFSLDRKSTFPATPEAAMKKLAALSIAVFAVSGPAAFAGGGLLQSLPKDGTWTKYYMEMKQEAPATKEVIGEFTLKSVGSVTENGKKCRWIEIEMKAEEGGKKRHSIMKFLVNEKHLKPGSKEAPEVVRGWNRQDTGSEVKELSEMEKNPNGMMSIFFGGHRKDVKTLKDAKVVDYQKGKLKITDGTSGKLEMDLGPNAPQGFKYDVTQSLWSHKSVPFGTAAMELKMLIKRKEMVVANMTMKFTVQDHGTGAKSALPDKN
jgi:hypothetical protein